MCDETRRERQEKIVAFRALCLKILEKNKTAQPVKKRNFPPFKGYEIK